MSSTKLRLLQSLSISGALALFVSCAPVNSFGSFDPSDDPGLTRDLAWVERTPAPDRDAGFSYWNDNGSREPMVITIDLGAQAAYVYRGRDLIGRSRVATGKRGHRTPTGSFSLLDKQAEKRSNLYGRILDANGDVVISDADSRTDAIPPGGRYVGASMPYWMRLTSGGIGMHAGPIPKPGRPASHGCIRMPKFMARQFFRSVPVGTPVNIIP